MLVSCGRLREAAHCFLGFGTAIWFDMGPIIDMADGSLSFQAIHGYTSSVAI